MRFLHKPGDRHQCRKHSTKKERLQFHSMRFLYVQVKFILPGTQAFGIFPRHMGYSEVRR